MTLLERIKQINEESKKWQDAVKGRWAGMLTEDVKHWNEYDIYTAEQLDNYLDACNKKDVREMEQDNYYN
jgi:hypothetical protein